MHRFIYNSIGKITSIFALICSVGCGVKGPPLPPETAPVIVPVAPSPSPSGISGMPATSLKK